MITIRRKGKKVALKAESFRDAIKQPRLDVRKDEWPEAHRGWVTLQTEELFNCVCQWLQLSEGQTPISF